MKVNYYVLVNENGNMIITDLKLPFYWNKEVAQEAAGLFRANIKPIRIDELKVLINR